VAVRGSDERQADLLGQADRGPVEVDSRRIEMAELDGIEEIDFLEEPPPQGVRGGKERVGRHDQPLRPTEPAQVGEGPNPFRRHVDVVEENVLPSTVRLDRESGGLPARGVALEIPAEGHGVVLVMLRTWKPAAAARASQLPRTVGDEPFPLPRVEVAGRP